MLLLTAAFLMTGGSINVLEVPFAKTVLGADELETTLLFFASALGPITFSISLSQFKYPVAIKWVVGATLIGASAIFDYVYIDSIPFVYPLLFSYGLVSAYQNYAAMTLVQRYSSVSQLARNTVLLNTVTQSMTLLSAALGVLLADSLGVTMASMCFNGLTIAIVMCTAVALYWRILDVQV